MSDEENTANNDESRLEYRDLLHSAEDLQQHEKTGLEITAAVESILQRVNLLFKENRVDDPIKNTDEVILDAKVVATSSDLLLNVTESIDFSLNTYDPPEFARKLRTNLMSSEDPESELNWNELHKVVKTILKRPPAFNTLFGEIGETAKEKKPVKGRRAATLRKANQQAEEPKEPEKITQLTREEDTVEDTVKFLHWALCESLKENQTESVNYFRFVVDPKSFTNTIENMFHLSFLVRDGKVSIQTAEDSGLMSIQPVAPQTLKKAKKDGMPYKQNIISLDMDMWKNISEVNQIENCFLEKWKTRWDQRRH